MKESIKYFNQKTVILTTIISVLILITIQIFFELIFILPIIYYNKIIISYLGMAIDNN